MSSPSPRLCPPRLAVDPEIDALARSRVLVALTGRRGRPLHDLGLEGTGDRVLAVFRTGEALEEAAQSFELRTEDGELASVEVDGVHALAHVGAARLAGLVIDPGAIDASLVTPAAARLAIGRARGALTTPPPAPVDTPPPEPSATPRVVIVDDDPLILKSLERFLTSRGATVFTVVSSLEAAAVATLHRPTVLVLDVMMPGMDGERVWGLFARGNARPPHVIFYSGIGGRELANIARGDPRVERVSKESEPSELWAAILRAHEKACAA